MHTPKVSIIVPIRNVAKYIRQTIESILEQSSKDWEMLVIDGASTDGTVAIVQEYAARHPEMIRVVSEPDEGPWHAFDKGMDLARGEFITTICGQDGMLEAEWLERALAMFEEDPALALVWAPTREMSEDGTLMPEGHVVHSHFMKPESRWDAFRHLAAKGFRIIKELLFGSMDRKRIILRNLFSKTAPLRLNLLAHRTFPEGRTPQKEQWFHYWLETGIPFPDQGSIVAKQVYLECAERYPIGSRMFNHMTDFNYNFNHRGYCAAYIPMYATFGRTHPGNSGATRAGELHAEFEKYLQKIVDLRDRVKRGAADLVIRDRKGKVVGKRRLEP